MAISVENREDFKLKSEPYKTKIQECLNKEKEMLAIMSHDNSGLGYKRIILCESMIEIATYYIAINALSVELLKTKNNDALNDARKILYKAIIYLEETVSNFVDVQYSEIEDKLAEIANIPISKRHYLIRKLGLAIKMLVDAFGDNSKWRWSFVELQGRFAIVAKNFIDMKQACKDYFEPSSADYDDTVLYLRLIKKLIDKAAKDYRDRYELSTRRTDDIRLAINFLSASRRISILLGNSEEAEEIKKKAIVWKEKMEKDHKAGAAKIGRAHV